MKEKIIKGLRVVFGIAFIVMLFVCIDFGMTYLYSLMPEANDGITGPSLIMRLLWGEDGWIREAYFEVFCNATYVTYFIFLGNVILYFMGRKKKDNHNTGKNE